MESKGGKEVEHVREIMLTTLELQLQVVRSMIKDLGHQPKIVVR